MTTSSKLGVVSGAALSIPVTFILEVAGAGRAVWGMSEAFGLRNDENRELWKCAAYAAFGAGLLRYGMKFVRKPDLHHRGKGFWDSFFMAVRDPHQIIIDEFYRSDDEEIPSLRYSINNDGM